MAALSHHWCKSIDGGKENNSAGRDEKPTIN